MAWSNNSQLSPFDVLATVPQSNNVEEVPGTIGTLGWTADGRKFRLGLVTANGTTLAPCKNTQGPAQVAAYHLGTVSAQAAGDRSIVYTFAGGATTVALNTFAGAYLSIVTATGSPQTVMVSGNPAVTSSLTITLTLQDPLVLATVNTATAEIYVQPYTNVIIAPASAPTGFETGVPLVSIAATSATLGTYGWFQVSGPALVLGQGTTGQGLGGAASGTTAGALAVVAATTVDIARAVEAGADGLYTMWDLAIN